MTLLSLALLLQSSVEARAGGGLTIYSLTFMLVAMGAATSLAAWCFIRILRGKRHFDPDGTGPASSPVPGDVERRDRR